MSILNWPYNLYKEVTGQEFWPNKIHEKQSLQRVEMCLGMIPKFNYGIILAHFKGEIPLNELAEKMHKPATEVSYEMYKCIATLRKPALLEILTTGHKSGSPAGKDDKPVSDAVDQKLISWRTYDTLISDGIIYVSQLEKLNIHQMRSLKGIGAKSCDEILRYLDYLKTPEKIDSIQLVVEEESADLDNAIEVLRKSGPSKYRLGKSQPKATIQIGVVTIPVDKLEEILDKQGYALLRKSALEVLKEKSSKLDAVSNKEWDITSMFRDEEVVECQSSTNTKGNLHVQGCFETNYGPVYEVVCTHGDASGNVHSFRVLGQDAESGKIACCMSCSDSRGHITLRASDVLDEVQVMFREVSESDSEKRRRFDMIARNVGRIRTKELPEILVKTDDGVLMSADSFIKLFKF